MTIDECVMRGSDASNLSPRQSYLLIEIGSIITGFKGVYVNLPLDRSSGEYGCYVGSTVRKG